MRACVPACMCVYICDCVKCILYLQNLHSLAFFVCRRSSSASDYSFSEEPITGRSWTGTVTQVPQDCGAVQGTSPVKAEGVAIHLVL